MSEVFTIDFSYSTSHLIFPRIIIGLLILLGAILLITNFLKRLRDQSKVFKFKLFTDNYDKAKFYGSIVLLITYAVSLEQIGFFLSSVIFVTLLTLLYIGNLKRKSILISLVNSMSITFVFWYVFGQLFDITLP
ncbi:hypothetical protein HNR44_002022 [Geomicrobium halophilum]|uniref:DUF1468 domain-containing protein n=1 Tax=Geomicrobium halophilum TaxID=549000 RepID=A0A841PQE7_9BACL|nr:tripartite tricarboxylate transporter TctB family protein [Geomicrobium halophilum]MBB6450044.1 hypothetical protein [Geomicrobium halophilum]